MPARPVPRESVRLPNGCSLPASNFQSCFLTASNAGLLAVGEQPSKLLAQDEHPIGALEDMSGGRPSTGQVGTDPPSTGRNPCWSFRPPDGGVVAWNGNR